MHDATSLGQNRASRRLFCGDRSLVPTAVSVAWPLEWRPLGPLPRWLALVAASPPYTSRPHYVAGDQPRVVGGPVTLRRSDPPATGADRSPGVLASRHRFDRCPARFPTAQSGGARPLASPRRVVIGDPRRTRAVVEQRRPGWGMAHRDGRSVPAAGSFPVRGREPRIQLVGLLEFGDRVVQAEGVGELLVYFLNRREELPQLRSGDLGRAVFVSHYHGIRWR